MRIKVKIKTLVLSAGGFLILTFLLVRLAIPQIELYIAEKQLSQGKVEAKQKIFEALDTVSETQKWETIREHMIENDGYYSFNIYLGPDSSFVQGGASETAFTSREKQPYLREYVTGAPVDWYLAEAVKQLAEIYLEEGKTEKAILIIDDVIARYPPYEKELRQNLELEKLRIFMERREESRAYSLLEEFHGRNEAFTGDQAGELALLEARLLLGSGKAAAAKELVQAKYDELKKQYEQEAEEYAYDEEQGEWAILTELQSFLDHMQYANEEDFAYASVSGRLMKNDGTPVSHAGVYLRREADVYHSVSEDEPYKTVTDEEGYFTFTDVIPGIYQVFLGFSFEQIDGWTYPASPEKWLVIEGGKEHSLEMVLNPLIELSSPVNQQVVKEKEVRFEWEEFPGAAYYNISLGMELGTGGSVSYHFREGITANHLSVPAEEMYDMSGGVAFDEIGEVDPVSILAFANSENRFIWSVEAYDSNGRMLSRSGGYRLNEETIGNLPFFYLKERELTKADRLYLDGEIEKAYELYEESYRNNPEDRHSLRMLARMRPNPLDGAEGPPDEYEKRWAEISTSANDASRMADYYGKERDWERYLSWHEEYIKKAGKLSDYDLGFHGQMLMDQGRPEEGIDYLRQSVKEDPDNRFIGSLLAALLSEGNSLDEALSLARQYPDFGSDETDWIEAIENMKEESVSVPGYTDELKQVLNLVYGGLEEEFEEWAGRTEHHALRAFVQAASNVD